MEICSSIRKVTGGWIVTIRDEEIVCTTFEGVASLLWRADSGSRDGDVVVVTIGSAEPERPRAATPARRHRRSVP